MKTWKTILLGIVPVAALVLGSAMLNRCSQSAAAGRIVSVDGQSVTVETAREGPATHEVAPEAKITLDGKPAGRQAVDSPDAAQEDQPQAGEEGMSTRVALRLDSREPPSVMPIDKRHDEMRFEGEIRQVGKDFVRLRHVGTPVPVAAEMVFVITGQTEIVINGRAAILEDLREGLTVTIAAEQHGELFVARRIEVGPTLL